ncbi:MAG: type II toxin-antitoxin system RelE/ParE family toxin [Leptospira sp.]|nr:type II toxin-antitoxin system RelE/ParE family toxin [Leptospira sp.]
MTLSDIVEIVSRIFKTSVFHKWLKKSNLKDEDLCNSIDELKKGLLDAKLGKNIIKKRIAIPGKGKRGGARTILATNHKSRWFFIYGFEKSVASNVNQTELNALGELASDLLALDDDQLDIAIENKSIMEICNEKKQK